MAEHYRIVGQRPGVVTIGGANTQDVVIIGITTVPNGTYIEFTLPQADATPKLVAQSANGYGIIVELVWAVAWVQGVTWVQQINASNQLESALIVTVVSTSGNSTGNVTLLLSRLDASYYDPLIASEHKRLDAVEAL